MLLEEMVKDKLAVVSITSFLAWCAGAPTAIKSAGFVLLWMVVIDWVTGVLSAMTCRELSSSKMRKKFFAKSWEYFIIMFIALCTSILSGEYMIIHLAFLGLIACEVLSFFENLVRIQERTGVVLPGPISPFLKFLSAYFALPDDTGAVVVRTVNSIPRSPTADDPVITFSEVKTMGPKPEKPGQPTQPPKESGTPS